MIASKILIKNIYESPINNNFLYRIIKLSSQYFSSQKVINHIQESNYLKYKDLSLKNYYSLNKNTKLRNISYSSNSFIKYNLSILQNKNKVNNDNTEQLGKKNNKKYYFNLLAFTGISSFMAYTIFKQNEREINQTIKCTFKHLNYYYIYIKNFIELPFNSFVLLDKLELVNEPKEKTLILNLDKTLVCYKYSLFNGFKIIQRPGLKHFINELSDYYEIIIYSNEDRTLIEYISSLIDKNNNKIRFKLGTECIKYVNGIPIKDLDYLNRDINNTILIDFDINNVSSSHKNNTIILPCFEGDGKDRELFFIIPFLKIISNRTNTVQSYIKKYGNYNTYKNFYKENKNNQNIIIKE